MFFIKILSFLPLSTCHKLAYIVASILYFLNIKDKKIITTNINLYFNNFNAKEKSILVKKNLIELVKSIFEVGKIWFCSNNWVEKKIQKVEGDFLIKNEKPAIILAPHIGCWEIIGRFLASTRKNYYSL